MCVGETLAQLPDRAQRLSNWATAVGTGGTAGTSLAVSNAIGTGSGTGTGASNAISNVIGTGTAANKIKNGTGNSSGSSGGVFLLSQLRELPHVLVVNEWGLHHHR